MVGFTDGDKSINVSQCAEMISNKIANPFNKSYTGWEIMIKGFKYIGIRRELRNIFEWLSRNWAFLEEAFAKFITPIQSDVMQKTQRTVKCRLSVFGSLFVLFSLHHCMLIRILYNLFFTYHCCMATIKLQLEVHFWNNVFVICQKIHRTKSIFAGYS